MTLSEILRWIFTAFGALLAVFEPTLPYIIICTLAILYDSYTAWSLDRRVRAAHPDKTNKDDGKFNSHHFGKVIVTLIKAYALIILAYLVSIHITDAWPVDVAKVAAGSICFWQVWSILENESSCNGAKWAKIAQRFLIDKTSRHINFDLSELQKEDKA